MLANGFIRNGYGKTPKLKVGLSSKDLKHLEKFRDWISPSRPIKYYDRINSPIVKIDIGNKFIVRSKYVKFGEVYNVISEHISRPEGSRGQAI